MTLGLPAIDRDPSWAAVIGLLERWQALPVQKALVWHMPSADPVTLAHLAHLLGVGDLDLSSGDPLVVLRNGVDLRKRRGTGKAIREGLRALGYEPTLEKNVTWLHDGTFTHNGLYTHGSDQHWAIIVVTLDTVAPLTLTEAQLAWRAANREKSRRDWIRLRVRVGGVTVQFYRSMPEAA